MALEHLDFQPRSKPQPTASPLFEEFSRFDRTGTDQRPTNRGVDKRTVELAAVGDMLVQGPSAKPKPVDEKDVRAVYARGTAAERRLEVALKILNSASEMTDPEKRFNQIQLLHTLYLFGQEDLDKAVRTKTRSLVDADANKLTQKSIKDIRDELEKSQTKLPTAVDNKSLKTFLSQATHLPEATRIALAIKIIDSVNTDADGCILDDKKKQAENRIEKLKTVATLFQSPRVSTPSYNDLFKIAAINCLRYSADRNDPHNVNEEKNLTWLKDQMRRTEVNKPTIENEPYFEALRVLLTAMTEKNYDVRLKQIEAFSKTDTCKNDEKIKTLILGNPEKNVDGLLTPDKNNKVKVDDLTLHGYVRKLAGYINPPKPTTTDPPPPGETIGPGQKALDFFRNCADEWADWNGYYKALSIAAGIAGVSAAAGVGVLTGWLSYTGTKKLVLGPGTFTYNTGRKAFQGLGSLFSRSVGSLFSRSPATSTPPEASTPSAPQKSASSTSTEAHAPKGPQKSAPPVSADVGPNVPRNFILVAKQTENEPTTLRIVAQNRDTKLLHSQGFERGLAEVLDLGEINRETLKPLYDRWLRELDKQIDAEKDPVKRRNLHAEKAKIRSGLTGLQSDAGHQEIVDHHVAMAKLAKEGKLTEMPPITSKWRGRLKFGVGGVAVGVAAATAFQMAMAYYNSKHEKEQKKQQPLESIPTGK